MPAFRALPSPPAAAAGAHQVPSYLASNPTLPIGPRESHEATVTPDLSQPFSSPHGFRLTAWFTIVDTGTLATAPIGTVH